jgi:hypothetical protein
MVKNRYYSFLKKNIENSKVEYEEEQSEYYSADSSEKDVEELETIMSVKCLQSIEK